MMWKSALKTLRIRRYTEDDDDELAEDVHFRLMQQYKDVPEWVYFIVLCVSMVIGMVGIAIYPTETSPVVVLYGIIMPLIALVPVGLVQSVTGIQVGMNVLAEFIGGSFVEGECRASLMRHGDVARQGLTLRRKRQRPDLVQDIRLYLMLPSTQLFERSEARALHQDSALVHVLVPDGSHSYLHLRQQRYPQFSNVVQGCLHSGCGVWLHM